jgi:hypothetical protein
MSTAAMDLHWIPLGADGHCGRFFEAVAHGRAPGWQAGLASARVAT